MQIPSRFTIAVHILTLIAQNKGNETKLTSDLMASSVSIQLLSAKPCHNWRKQTWFLFKGEVEDRH